MNDGHGNPDHHPGCYQGWDWTVQCSCDYLRQIDLLRADAKLGRDLFKDLYKRHWVDGDDHDAQLERMMGWAKIKAET